MRAILFLAFLVMPLGAKPASKSPKATGAAVRSGSTPGEIQSSIDNAAPGSTVRVASGNHTWTSGIRINKPLILAGDNTTIVNGLNSGVLITVTPSASGTIEISSLSFEQGPVGDGTVRHLAVYHAKGAQPVLVHDCNFGATHFGMRCIEWGENGGVISHCIFTSREKADVSCIAFKALGIPETWREPSSLGSAGDPEGTKNTYLEDCTFKDAYLQALDLDDNSRTVVRHCTFDNSAVTSHGACTSPYGMRQFELYDNTFIFTLGGNCEPNPYPLNLNYWFYVRGGTGIVADNIMPAINSCAWGTKGSIQLTVYNIRRGCGQVPCQTRYPAIHQVGQGPEGMTDPIYAWNNSGGVVSLIDYNPDDCGNGQTVSNYVQEGRDYILGPRANYQKYTYPHPLAAGGKPIPSPTASPTVTPVPTATPSPTPTPPPEPTPTPPPGTSYSDWLDDLADWIRQHPAVPNYQRNKKLPGD
jgi:hypothetical protein